nr:hypothetical protein [Candidatus Sigynarchaeota archaeon]
MSNEQSTPILTDDQLKELCEKLGLKTMKKYKILVAKLVKKTGTTDVKKLSVALKKATIAS